VEPIDVVVVGGGLAGWTAAASAAGAGRTVQVLDPSDRGGRAATDVVDGFRLNRGAHALYEAGPGLAVLGRFGIDPAGHRPPLRGGRARFGDQIGLLPSSVGALARTSLLSLRERARLAQLFASVGRWQPATLGDRSTNAWFDELGLSGRTRAMAATFIRLATYASDHDALAADVAAGQLQLAVRGVRYLDGGWSTLVDAVRATATARGATSVPAKVHAVEPGGNGVAVTTGDGVLRASVVVLAAGSPGACATLLPDAPPAWTDLGPSAVASCLDVGLDHVPELTTLLGVDRPLYAIRHSPPAALAPAGGSVVHAMHYLREDEHLEAGASRAVLEEHLAVAGIDVAGVATARYLHRMTTVSALATPERGGLAGRPGIASASVPGVLVAGDWVGPTGHLADASLASGEAAGTRAARDVEARVVAR
jgi:phytoene dehydrogenase-like protein